jgi:hypothetical protein
VHFISVSFDDSVHRVAGGISFVAASVNVHQHQYCAQDCIKLKDIAKTWFTELFDYF